MRRKDSEEERIINVDGLLAFAGTGVFHFALLLASWLYLAVSSMSRHAPLLVIQKASVQFNVSSLVGKSWVSTLHMSGKMVGAYFGGAMADAFGRRRCITAGSLLIGISLTVLTVNSNLIVYLLAVFFAGVGAGDLLSTGIPHLSEFFKRNWKGPVLVVWFLALDFGALFTLTASWLTMGSLNISSASLFSVGSDSIAGWRMFLFICCTVAFVAAAITAGMSETPAFLFSKRDKKLKAVVEQVRDVNKLVPCCWEHIEQKQNYQDIFVRLQITDTNSNKKCIHGIFAVLDFFKMMFLRTVKIYNKRCLCLTVQLNILFFTLGYASVTIEMWFPEYFKYSPYHHTNNTSLDTIFYQDAIISFLVNIPATIFTASTINIVGGHISSGVFSLISAFSVIGIWRAVISDSSVIYLTFKIIYIMASVSALRAAQVIAGNSYHTDIRSTAIGVHAGVFFGIGSASGNLVIRTFIDDHQAFLILVTASLLSIAGIASAFLPAIYSSFKRLGKTCYNSPQLCVCV